MRDTRKPQTIVQICSQGVDINILQLNNFLQLMLQQNVVCFRCVGRLCLEVLQQLMFYNKMLPTFLLKRTNHSSVNLKKLTLVGTGLLSAALEHTQLGNPIKILLESLMLLKHILSTSTQVFVLNSQICCSRNICYF